MESENGSDKSILLAEDDPLDAELTLVALEEHHLANKVVVVRDGEQALDYLYRRGVFKTRGNHNPVLVLLDLKMPKINGLEVLKIIKADEHLKLIPVVVLSSSRQTADLLECYQHGVNAYVVKPVDFGKFMETVKQLGHFWTAVNQPPPPPARREENGSSSSNGILHGREKMKDEIPAAHSAPG
jgi:CheY-like chemotaxis protein